MTAEIPEPGAAVPESRMITFAEAAEHGNWVQLEAAAPAAPSAPSDVRPRADGRRGLDITCGKCGEDYGTNVSDVDEIECVTCEARRCPHCATWFGGEEDDD